MENSTQIRVIMKHDGDLWVAQCLEFDIGAQAESPEDVQNRLNVALKAELQISVEMTGEPFGGIDPAPKHFFDLWEGRPEFTTSRHVSIIDGGRNVELNVSLAA